MKQTAMLTKCCWNLREGIGNQGMVICGFALHKKAKPTTTYASKIESVAKVRGHSNRHLSVQLSNNGRSKQGSAPNQVSNPERKIAFIISSGVASAEAKPNLKTMDIKTKIIHWLGGYTRQEERKAYIEGNRDMCTQIWEKAKEPNGMDVWIGVRHGYTWK